MKMKVFVDVGGHHGESAIPALKWADLVHTMEPCLKNCTIIEGKTFPGSNLIVHPYGWADQRGYHTLFNAGSEGASIFKDKPKITAAIYAGYEDNNPARLFVRASAWVQQFLLMDDKNLLKLNCEGSEAAILEDLLQTETLAYFNVVGVDFDCRWIPSIKHKQKELKDRLHEFSLRFPQTKILDFTGKLRPDSRVQRMREQLNES